MRYILLICLCFLLQSLDAKKITIEGNVTDPTAQEIGFSFINNVLTSERAVYTTKIRADNSFGMTMDIGESDLLQIAYNEEKYEMFVSPADQKFKVSFNGNGLVQSIHFEGVNGFTNNFVKSYLKNCKLMHTEVEEYESAGLVTVISKDVANFAKSYGDYDYFRKIEEDFKYAQRHLFAQTNLDMYLFKYLNKLINWRFDVNKIAYFLLNKDRLSSNQIRNFWGQYGVMQNSDINDDASLKYPEYQNVLSAFVHYLSLESPGNKENIDLSYYQFVEGNLTDRSRYFMLAKLMLENYQRLSNPRLAHRKFKGFEKEVPYKEYAATLKSIFGGSLEFVPNKPVPDFEVMDMNEQIKKLSQYKGKVVYVSFWASWCAPCLKSFRESYAVREELEKMGVVFMNINFDKTEMEWRNAVSRNGIQGLNVFAQDMTLLQKELKISSLPYYLLVNKSGMHAYLSSTDLEFSKEEFYPFLKE